MFATPAQHHSVQATAGQQQATQPVAGPRETVRAGGSSTSIWFRSHAAADAADGGSPAEAPPPAVPGLPVPGTLPVRDGLPARDERPGPGELPVRGGPSGPGLWADDQHAAQIIAEPVRGDHTAAGLPVRVPRANLLPGSAGGGRSADAARRSPELVRSRLDGFQGGIRRAKGEEPGTGEENGR
jgi:hypothetical protein